MNFASVRVWNTNLILGNSWQVFYNLFFFVIGTWGAEWMNSSNMTCHDWFSLKIVGRCFAMLFFVIGNSSNIIGFRWRWIMFLLGCRNSTVEQLAKLEIRNQEKIWIVSRLHFCNFKHVMSLETIFLRENFM